jgi:hypothetical protein
VMNEDGWRRVTEIRTLAGLVDAGPV